ncbi:MAG: hypothetical protein WD872_19985, partial [Pirellulaceae bacterium]
EPKAEYEAGVASFIQSILADDEFTGSLQQFVQPLVAPGRVNSLAQALVKLTSPGVPDIYQGTELWDLSLVDPDNRRPVDFALRRKLLAEVVHLTPEEILARGDEGLPKLWLTRQVLHLRRRHPQWFGKEGCYAPLLPEGARAGSLFAFLRADSCLAAIPLRVLSTQGQWGDTRLPLPQGEWVNTLTGESCRQAVPAADLFARFPVALLVRQDSLRGPQTATGAT